MSNHSAMIQALSDYQALSILESITAEFGSEDFSETVDEQCRMIQRLFRDMDIDASVSSLASTTPSEAAKVSRDVLLLLSEASDVRPSLEKRLNQPLTQETAGVEWMLGAPVVLTGCLTVLYVVGHTRIRRDTDGAFFFDYDPSMRTAMGRTFKDLVAALGRLITLME